MGRSTYKVKTYLCSNNDNIICCPRVVFTRVWDSGMSDIMSQVSKMFSLIITYDKKVKKSSFSCFRPAQVHFTELLLYKAFSYFYYYSTCKQTVCTPDNLFHLHLNHTLASRGMCIKEATILNWEGLSNFFRVSVYLPTYLIYNGVPKVGFTTDEFYEGS